MKTTSHRKLLAVLLAVAMLLSVLPTVALSASGTTANGPGTIPEFVHGYADGLSEQSLQQLFMHSSDTDLLSAVNVFTQAMKDAPGAANAIARLCDALIEKIVSDIANHSGAHEKTLIADTKMLLPAMQKTPECSECLAEIGIGYLAAFEQKPEYAEALIDARDQMVSLIQAAPDAAEAIASRTTVFTLCDTLFDSIIESGTAVELPAKLLLAARKDPALTAGVCYLMSAVLKNGRIGADTLDYFCDLMLVAMKNTPEASTSIGLLGYHVMMAAQEQDRVLEYTRLLDIVELMGRFPQAAPGLEKMVEGITNVGIMRPDMFTEGGKGDAYICKIMAAVTKAPKAADALGTLADAWLRAMGLQPEIYNSPLTDEIIDAMANKPEIALALSKAGEGAAQMGILHPDLLMEPETPANGEDSTGIALDLMRQVIDGMNKEPKAADGLGIFADALVRALAQQQRLFYQPYIDLVIDSITAHPEISYGIAKSSVGISSMGVLKPGMFIDETGSKPAPGAVLIFLKELIDAMIEAPDTEVAFGIIGDAWVRAAGQQSKILTTPILTEMRDMLVNNPKLSYTAAKTGVGIAAMGVMRPEMLSVDEEGKPGAVLAFVRKLFAAAETAVMKNCAKNASEAAFGFGIMGDAWVRGIAQQPKLSTALAGDLLMDAMVAHPEAAAYISKIAVGVASVGVMKPDLFAVNETTGEFGVGIVFLKKLLKAIDECPEAAEGLANMGDDWIRAMGQQPAMADDPIVNQLIEAMLNAPASAAGIGQIAKKMASICVFKASAELDEGFKELLNDCIEAISAKPAAARILGSLFDAWATAYLFVGANENVNKMLKQILLEYCAYDQPTVLSEGSLQMKLNGREIGYFTFARFEGGWSIQTASGKYLAAKDGDLRLSSKPFAWKYANNSFYTTVTKSVQRGGYWFLFWYIPNYTAITVTETLYLPDALTTLLTLSGLTSALELDSSSYSSNFPNSYISDLVDSAELLLMTDADTMNKIISVDPAIPLSHQPIKTEFSREVYGKAHQFERYTTLGNGKHLVTCTICGETRTEACTGGAVCTKCGAPDPTLNEVSVSVRQDQRTVYGWFWTRYTVYTAEISATSLNIGIAKTEYSTDQRIWRTGSVLTSNTVPTHFWIRVTDVNGAVHHFEYLNSVIIGNPPITLTLDHGDHCGPWKALTPADVEPKEVSGFKPAAGTQYYILIDANKSAAVYCFKPEASKAEIDDFLAHGYGDTGIVSAKLMIEAEMDYILHLTVDDRLMYNGASGVFTEDSVIAASAESIED